MTIDEFVAKYGTETPSLLIERFILLAPEFKGDCELAHEIGKMLGDLQSVLNAVAHPVK